MGGAFVFSDGSLLEGGNVGGGAFIVDDGEKEVECGIGNVVTVWDGEFAGMAEGLASLLRGGRVLILADSKAAIAAVKRQGGQEKPGPEHLQEVVNEKRSGKGEGGVRLGWVKAHMGILESEAADVFAKQAAEGVPLVDHETWMSGGGIRQWTKNRKREYM